MSVMGIHVYENAVYKKLDRARPKNYSQGYLSNETNELLVQGRKNAPNFINI